MIIDRNMNVIGHEYDRKRHYSYKGLFILHLVGFWPCLFQVSTLISGYYQMVLFIQMFKVAGGGEVKGMKRGENLLNKLHSLCLLRSYQLGPYHFTISWEQF